MKFFFWNPYACSILWRLFNFGPQQVSFQKTERLLELERRKTILRCSFSFGGKVFLENKTFFLSVFFFECSPTRSTIMSKLFLFVFDFHFSFLFAKILWAGRYPFHSKCAFFFLHPQCHEFVPTFFYFTLAGMGPDVLEVHEPFGVSFFRGKLKTFK